jgi:RNA polymerase sigma factor (sigma-70 family)
VGNIQSPSFTEIFEHHKEKVYRLCLGYTGDEDVARDLMQESFIKVWQHLGEFRNESAVGSWIYRITANTCLGHIRQQDRSRTDRLKTHHENIAGEPTERDEQLELLHRCIGELEEQDRILITLVLESVPQREIADILGIAEGNVRVKIHRAKEKLTRLFSRHEEL